MKFVTLFPEFLDVHIDKDLCQIPIFWSKIDNDGAEMYTYSKVYKKDININRFTIKFLSKDAQFKRIQMPSLLFILRNARKMEILNVYHWQLKTFIYGLMYKLVNPNGFLYIKLDNDFYRFNENNSLITPKGVFSSVYRFIEKIVLIKSDLISVETKSGLDLLNKSKNYRNYSHKIMYLPSAINMSTDKVTVKPFSQKDNYILVSGRLGIKQKNTEMILEAIKDINMKNWKILFVGSIDDNFKIYLQEYFKKYPDKKDVCIFHGWISDKEKYYQIMNNAKVLCLTSRWESFGLVAFEAMFFGAYVVTTDVISANEITKDGNLGKIIKNEDVNALRKEITSIINGELDIETGFERRKNYIKNNFSWEPIVMRLHKEIKERMKNG